MAESINVVAFVRVAADKVGDALPHVKVLVEESRKEEGVEVYDVYADTKEPGTYVFIERYANLEVLTKHQ
jgi:quinol monooxygenase YgiN